MAKVENWLGFAFSTGSTTGSDYLAFEKNMRADLKKQAEANGMELYAFHKNHYEFCAVLREKETGAFAYISISDVRFFKDEWHRSTLYRTMKNEKDWTGGANHYAPWKDIGKAVKDLLLLQSSEKKG